MHFVELGNGFVFVRAERPLLRVYVYGHYLAVVVGFHLAAYVPLVSLFSQSSHDFGGIWFSWDIFLRHIVLYPGVYPDLEKWLAGPSIVTFVRFAAKRWLLCLSAWEAAGSFWSRPKVSCGWYRVMPWVVG